MRLLTAEWLVNTEDYGSSSGAYSMFLTWSPSGQGFLTRFDSRKTAKGDDTRQKVVHPRVGDQATLALVCVEEVVPRVCHDGSSPLQNLHPSGTSNVL